jgi:hypothetical protein
VGDGVDDVEVVWSCRVTGGSWELRVAAVDDPFEHTARAVPEPDGSGPGRWSAWYYRGDELVSEALISVPAPFMPPLATLRGTLGSLRREAEYWARHPTTR